MKNQWTKDPDEKPFFDRLREVKNKFHEHEIGELELGLLRLFYAYGHQDANDGIVYIKNI